MLKASKEYADTTQAIYDCLKQHVGADKAISAQALSRLFDVTERELRSMIATIRKSRDFEGVVLSNNHGYFFGTAEDFDRANKRLVKQALSLLTVAYSNKRKAGLNGQGKLADTNGAVEFLAAFQQEVKRIETGGDTN